MKNILTKAIPICVLFFLYASFVRAQDSKPTEQAETDTLQVFIQNAQYRQAIEYINQTEPTKELLFQKSLCYKNLNDYSSAIEVLNALTEEYPDDIPIKLQLALCYEVAAQYEKSTGCYDQLLNIDSTNTYFEVQKADLLYRSEKYNQALDT
jgi:tetratricopeptide (TPR) repeat protein